MYKHITSDEETVILPPIERHNIPEYMKEEIRNFVKSLSDVQCKQIEKDAAMLWRYRYARETYGQYYHNMIFYSHPTLSFDCLKKEFSHSMAEKIQDILLQLIWERNDRDRV